MEQAAGTQASSAAKERAMTSIVEKLSEYSIRLPSYAPGDHKILCPQCSHQRRNRTDPCLSVRVDPDGEGACWMCHHCDWRGATAQDDPRPEPPRRRRAPPPVPPPAASSEVEAWFRRRGIGADVLKRARVGFENHYLSQTGGKTPCIAFPYYRNGALVNVKYRSLEGKHFAQMKGGMPVFYGLDDLCGLDVDTERLIIVEGEVDKLTLDQCGLTNVLSVPDGAPARLRETVSEHDAKFEFLRLDAEKIGAFKKIILAVDNDGPGNVLAEELARRFGKERCYRARWPDQGDALCKDANETLIAHGAEVVRECIEAAEPYPIQGYHFWEVGMLAEYRVRGLERAFDTGWASLDQHMKIAPGQLTVVTGIPSHGKSEFIDALSVNLAMRHGWRFAMCSFENEIKDHAAKLAEKYLGLPFRDGPTRERMTEAELRRAEEWGREHFSFIRAEDASPTIDWLLGMARIALIRHGVNGLVIDPYNEIEHSRPNNMTETEYVSQILGRVKRFAVNHGVHVWFVAHPQKLKAENGKMPVPNLYDISGSAHWTNKADIGLTIYRPSIDSSEVEIHVGKVRHKWVGRPGKVTLEYDRVTGRYSEPQVRSHWSDI